MRLPFLRVKTGRGVIRKTKTGFSVPCACLFFTLKREGALSEKRKQGSARFGKAFSAEPRPVGQAAQIFARAAAEAGAGCRTQKDDPALLIEANLRLAGRDKPRLLSRLHGSTSRPSSSIFRVPNTSSMVKPLHICNLMEIITQFQNIVNDKLDGFSLFQ